MRILVDSFEYRCWHEVGHAAVCLHLGGSVDLIEFLDRDSRGHARTSCIVTPEIERSVACGGFAAEFFLVNGGHAERAREDDRDLSRILFHNATHDREDFFGRKLAQDEAFTEVEDREFMTHAIGPDGHGGMIPIFKLHLPGMRSLVLALLNTRRVDGRQIEELLRIGSRRHGLRGSSATPG